MINDALYLVCTFILIFEPTERLSAISKSTFIDDRERERESSINMYVPRCNTFACTCNILMTQFDALVFWYF